MKGTVEIYCVNTAHYHTVSGGDTIGELCGLIADLLDFEPICAKVNNKTVGLDYVIFSAVQIEFVPRTTPSGSRVYTRSLCMILNKAFKELFPSSNLRIEHSISKGHYCLSEGVKFTAESVTAIKERMMAIVNEDIPFLRHEALTRDVKEIFRTSNLLDKVQLLDSTHKIYTTYYSLGGTVDSYYGALAPSSGAIKVFDLIPYKEGMLLLSFDKENPDKAVAPIPQEKMYRAFTEQLDFTEILGISNIGELNAIVSQERAPLLINVAEVMHEKMIAAIAEDIAERFRRGGAKVVLLAGPSSSGKTTTTKRLGVHLITNLIRPKMISLDDYFVDREHTPLDEYGEYDYESLYALDLELFNSDLNRLINGERVVIPKFNFQTGARICNDANAIKLESDEILLIEGIHGLNPELTAHIEECMKYRVYVSALTTLSIDDHNWIPTTDNRLLRRIIRDYKYRGTSASQTIARWQSVRRGEEKWIFPYQENADAMFNSSLIFELAAFKEYAYPILSSVPRDTPEYSEANRLLTFLDYFTPINSTQIPAASLLREFLGGSIYE